jgi:CHAT domain-containing protein
VVAGPNLAHAAEEAAVVRRIARTGRVLSGEAATAAAVLRAVDGAAVAHFACHGRFHPENPLFSSLQMVDGPLTVYELERLRKAPELVLLSACDSAVSATGAGEELMGLTATLLALGCRTLIGAVAPISDVAAQPLMAGVHAALAAGRPPAVALAEARRSIDPADRAAFATGVAFGCFGAGS